MNNEKFVNVYIDILQKTLNDWLLQNVSLQANSKVTEETLNEQAENIQKLQIMVADANKNIDSLKEELQLEKQNKVANEASRIENLENAIKDHLNTIANLNTIKGEYESVKHQVQHVDTFRNELIKEREAHENTRNEIGIIQSKFENTIKELNEKIDYLQLTPAKRKKLEDEKLKSVFAVAEQEQPKEDSTIRDGGSF